ncbi:hypothetical protein D3C76_684350 [compost metagenome]
MAGNHISNCHGQQQQRQRNQQIRIAYSRQIAQQLAVRDNIYSHPPGYAGHGIANQHILLPRLEE